MAKEARGLIVMDKKEEDEMRLVRRRSIRRYGAGYGAG
jgi:hypothetical protein